MWCAGSGGKRPKLTLSLLLTSLVYVMGMIGVVLPLPVSLPLPPLPPDTAHFNMVTVHTQTPQWDLSSPPVLISMNPTDSRSRDISHKASQSIARSHQDGLPTGPTPGVNGAGRGWSEENASNLGKRWWSTVYRNGRLLLSNHSLKATLAWSIQKIKGVLGGARWSSKFMWLMHRWTLTNAHQKRTPMHNKHCVVLHHYQISSSQVITHNCHTNVHDNEI